MKVDLSAKVAHECLSPVNILKHCLLRNHRPIEVIDVIEPEGR